MKVKFYNEPILGEIDSRVVLKGVCGIWDSLRKELKIHTPDSNLKWEGDPLRTAIKSITLEDSTKWVDILVLTLESGENYNISNYPGLITIPFPADTKADIQTEYPLPSTIKYIEGTGSLVAFSEKDLESENDLIVSRGLWNRLYRYEQNSRDSIVSDSQRLDSSIGQGILTDFTFKTYSDLHIKCLGSFKIDDDGNEEREVQDGVKEIKVYGTAVERTWRMTGHNTPTVINQRTVPIYSVPGARLEFKGDPPLGPLNKPKYEISGWTIKYKIMPSGRWWVDLQVCASYVLQERNRLGFLLPDFPGIRVYSNALTLTRLFSD